MGIGSGGVVKDDLEEILSNLRNSDTYDWETGHELTMACVEDLAVMTKPLVRRDKTATLTAEAPDWESAQRADQARLAYGQAKRLLQAHRSENQELAIASVARALGHLESWS